MEFSYNDNGRVIEASFHSSTASGPVRTYSYGYDAGGWGNLVSVEDPEGNEYTYEYDGHLITEYSGSGCSECLTYRNEYDPQNRAIKQELGPEGLATEIEIEYGDKAGPRIVTTIVRDNEGNTSRTLVEEYYFDEDGHAIMKVRKPGGGLKKIRVKPRKKSGSNLDEKNQGQTSTIDR